jgi:AcrR family transcriptional regulator
MKRVYRQKKRAEETAATRQRIVEVTADLHRTLGPRATTVTEIARRAGVDRVTVYKHFPDEGALVEGCQEHWLALHPPPSLGELHDIAEPDTRLRVALLALWDWYERSRDMTANVLRDGPAMPAFATTLEQINGMRTHLANLLAEGRTPCPGLLPALRLVTEFRTWEVVVADAGLPADAAADLFVAWLNALPARSGGAAS